MAKHNRANVRKAYLADRPLIDGQPTAYVCERFLCQAPTTDAQELLSQVRSLLPR
jgi:uncharacterized protein YyaL (SSP411 family)